MCSLQARCTHVFRCAKSADTLRTYNLNILVGLNQRYHYPRFGRKRWSTLHDRNDDGSFLNKKGLCLVHYIFLWLILDQKKKIIVACGWNVSLSMIRDESIDFGQL